VLGSPVAVVGRVNLKEDTDLEEVDRILDLGEDLYMLSAQLLPSVMYEISGLRPHRETYSPAAVVDNHPAVGCSSSS
jgi:hypothetical protein